MNKGVAPRYTAAIVCGNCKNSNLLEDLEFDKTA